MSDKNKIEEEMNEENDIKLEENTEDITPESADLSGKLKKLKNNLKACQTEKSEYLAGWQRAKADYLNLKKETEDNRTEIIKWAKEGVLSDLFVLADSFEMAFGNKEAWEMAPENWRKGIEYIYNQLQTIFRDHGIEEIIPKVGEKFNHHYEQSIGTIETKNKDEDDIIDKIVKKGYKFHGRVIRPASVKVKHWKE